MPKTITSPERIFQHPWRAGHPFGRRLGPGRRWGMLCFFCFLLLVIGGYWYVTDSDRVRGLAEKYLSRARRPCACRPRHPLRFRGPAT